MTKYQKTFLDMLKPRTWYDVFPNQGTGGQPLPRELARDPLSAIRKLRRLGKVRVRHKRPPNPGQKTPKLPQVMRI